jgi:hypothetical protein
MPCSRSLQIILGYHEKMPRRAVDLSQRRLSAREHLSGPTDDLPFFLASRRGCRTIMQRSKVSFGVMAFFVTFSCFRECFPSLPDDDREHGESADRVGPPPAEQRVGTHADQQRQRQV